MSTRQGEGAAIRLQNFDPAAFLRDHWQRKPLLIRNPWASWRNPLEPDELAGLACESEVESRIVVRDGDTWSLEHGPIPETRFGRLGEAGWTLLVQAVDHHVPDMAALIEPFRFIPNWRIDDVMVSYAADGGGVGPHFDQYDVFLVQGLGRRRWQLGAPCDDDTALLPHDDLRLLRHFEATEEWVLEPGDMLYVPPRVPHNGVAVGGDCMTYSIGFRAPSRRELIAEWCDYIVSGLSDDDRYGDAGLALQSNAGEISPRALDALHTMVAEKVLDSHAFAAWFGRYNTAPRYPELHGEPETPIPSGHLRRLIAAGVPLRRNPASRFSFIAEPHDTVVLFVDGQSFECHGQTIALAQQLCRENCFAIEHPIPEASLVLIQTLRDQGSITFDED